MCLTKDIRDVLEIDGAINEKAKTDQEMANMISKMKAGRL